jgi:hypothetical protein
MFRSSQILIMLGLLALAYAAGYYQPQAFPSIELQSNLDFSTLSQWVKNDSVPIVRSVQHQPIDEICSTYGVMDIAGRREIEFKTLTTSLETRSDGMIFLSKGREVLTIWSRSESDGSAGNPNNPRAFCRSYRQ